MKKLSQINESPFYVTELPSTGEKVKFRPFLVKEERALLTAAESDDINTMYATLESVVSNCLQSPVKKLTTFDLEYLFVKIRGKSVGEISDITIKCEECGKDIPQSINLETVKIVTEPNHSKKIQFDDNYFIVMQYPSIDEIYDFENTANKEEAKRKLIKICIHSVYNGDDVYLFSEETDEEIEKYLDTLQPSQNKKLQYFIDTIPYVEIDHSWTCPSCKKSNNTRLKGIFSFF